MATAQAVDQGGLELESITEFGVAVGVNNSDRPSHLELSPFLDDESGNPIVQYHQSLRHGGASRALRAQPGMIGGITSMWLGATGPNLTFINAGLAGVIAIGESFRLVQQGVCPGMIAGGTFDLDDPWLVLSRLGSGTVNGQPPLPLASGAGCVLLEAASHIRRRRGRPLAEVLYYCPGQPDQSLRHRLTELDVQLTFSLTPKSVANSEFHLGQATAGAASAPFLQRLGDAMSATPAMHVALAAHILSTCKNESFGKRRAAVVHYADGDDQITILLGSI
jgi:hypothetical protein